MSRSVCPGIPMGSQDSIVYVVDDDIRVREALREIFTSLNISFATFGSVAEHLAYTKPDLPACLILDVKLPDISGPDFQRSLATRTTRPSCSSPDTATFRRQFARSKPAPSTFCRNPSANAI